MRFEQLEPRLVFHQSLVDGIPLNLDSLTQSSAAAPAIPDDIQFSNVQHPFRYASADLDAAERNDLIAASQQWAANPTEANYFGLTDHTAWRKPYLYHPPEITSDGIIVARRLASNADPHTMLQARINGSPCYHASGIYTREDYHYVISFDVRHPTSEASWLTESHWGIVMQLWGPRESGETPRNPPFSIYSRSDNGVPKWRISSFGDSRAITQSGEYEEHRATEVEIGTIGEWSRFHVEFVANPDGEGLIRTWLNGELIAQWLDIKNIYRSVVEGAASGPVNPMFGIYSSLPEDNMEVHLDNIQVDCLGIHQTSIAGAVTGAADLNDQLVFATNELTGQSYGTHTNRDGLYTLNIPAGTYTVIAVDELSGRQRRVRHVNTAVISQLVNLAIPTTDTPAADAATLSADVTGDGRAELINRVADGSWQVSSIDNQGIATTLTWGQWSTAFSWQHLRTADFNGDGRQDIVGQVEDGNWWVGLSTGNQFQTTWWGKWSAQVVWEDVLIGDFNGDGRSDIAGREASSGTWWVSQSMGDRFSTRPWGTWSSRVSWVDTAVGDFNGDGQSDIAGRVAEDGNWWIAISRGSDFRSYHFGVWSAAAGWNEVHAADFDGDGKTDLAGRTSDGNWWVGISTGSHLLSTHWGRWSTGATWTRVSVVDVNADGRADLVGRASGDGSWWVAESDGNQFHNHFWGVLWSDDEDWLAFRIDDFDGDGDSDLLGGTASGWLLYLL